MAKANDFDDLIATLSRQIRSARRAKGLSQEGLGFAAGVDRTYVSQVERGIANPSLLVLWRLADALDLKLRLSFQR